MTFNEIVNEVCAQLNLTSADAIARVGRKLNIRYKRVTTSCGMITSRRTTVSMAASIGVREMVWATLEKVLAISDRSTGVDRTLDEISFNEMRNEPVVTGQPTKFAIERMGSTTTTIILNCVPATAFTLYADGVVTGGTLSGTQEPAFPESFHDLLVEGVMADELRKMQKVSEATIAESVYERRLNDLRQFIAVSAYKDIYQGKTNTTNWLNPPLTLIP